MSAKTTKRFAFIMIFVFLALLFISIFMIEKQCKGTVIISKAQLSASDQQALTDGRFHIDSVTYMPFALDLTIRAYEDNKALGTVRFEHSFKPHEEITRVFEEMKGANRLEIDYHVNLLIYEVCLSVFFIFKIMVCIYGIIKSNKMEQEESW